jgi:hypothetical protein
MLLLITNPKCTKLTTFYNLCFPFGCEYWQLTRSSAICHFRALPGFFTLPGSEYEGVSCRGKRVLRTSTPRTSSYMSSRILSSEQEYRANTKYSRFTNYHNTVLFLIYYIGTRMYPESPKKPVVSILLEPNTLIFFGFI